MIIESPEEIEKYLKFNKFKNNSNSKESAHSKILNLFKRKKETKKSQELEQTEIFPQGIPLRSKFSNGQPIPKTAENYKKWRKLIFDTKGNFIDFKLLNKNGKQYTSKAYYIKCHIDTAIHIIENNWYSIYETQKSLIEKIKKDPNNFSYNIIIKNANSGHNFLMLHCDPKGDNPCDTPTQP